MTLWIQDNCYYYGSSLLLWLNYWLTRKYIQKNSNGHRAPSLLSVVFTPYWLMNFIHYSFVICIFYWNILKIEDLVINSPKAFGEFQTLLSPPSSPSPSPHSICILFSLLFAIPQKFLLPLGSLRFPQVPLVFITIVQQGSSEDKKRTRFFA